MPITSAGHADFVSTEAGEWWATFLATRPYRDDHYNLGRETFMLPVQWRNGWPEILAPRRPIPWLVAKPRLPLAPVSAVPTSGAFGVRDDFDTLPLYWIRIRATQAPWQRLRGGSLELDARPVALGSNGHPSFVARRLQHHWASASTSVRFRPMRPGDRAGIAVLQNESHFYALALAGGADGLRVQLERRAGESEPPDGVVIASDAVAVDAADRIALRIDARGDVYDFLYALRPGEWRVLARGLDGTLLSTKSAGGFVGATVGPFARSAG
jgi:alpha-N-arabinofuranosidase